MTGHGSSGMDIKYRSRLVAHLLALKDAPDTALLDWVPTIGVTATRCSTRWSGIGKIL
jgi:hypothetical protein